MYIKFELKKGFCNKLFYFFSICDIAIKKKYVLIEPYFGRSSYNTLFSEIYDIDYFNDKMRKYTKGEYNLMISLKDFNERERKSDDVIENTIGLWKHSENILAVQRDTNKMSESCTNITVMKALKLHSKYDEILNKYDVSNMIAWHVRTEHDWVSYSKKKKTGSSEDILVSIDDMIKMYKDKKMKEDIFFTTAEDHQYISSKFTKADMENTYYFNQNDEVEINSAINFEICLRAKRFIGLSRSTYSNLISLKRDLLKMGENYIYNLDNKIYSRIDKGLHCEASKSVKNKVRICKK